MTDERRRDDERDGLVIGPTTGGADVTREPRTLSPTARHDAQIAADVRRRLGEHASLDASGVDVRVKDGQVTLEGRVHDEPARHVAELIADAVPGVRGVVNRLDTARG
jgi:hyperosmotically inducible periplasmic protein